MNLKVIVGLLFLSLTACQSVKTGIDKTVTTGIDRRACKQVEERISLIEKFHSLEEGYSDELQQASNFLENLTLLSARSVYHYSDVKSETSIKDVAMWKSWYSKNKNLLYWDKVNHTVRLRNRESVAF